MLWVAALLSLIIWVVGWSSGFLGLRIHVFLLLAILAALGALLPSVTPDDVDGEPEEEGAGGEQADDGNAKSVPGPADEPDAT